MTSKQRLDDLMKDIDDNIDNLVKEKQEFYSIDANKSHISSKLNDGKGAYLYSKEDTEKIEKINQSLQRVTPMLPPPEHSMMESDKESNYDRSKFLNDDTHSMRSMPLSVATKRSNFTLLSHQTFNT